MNKLPDGWQIKTIDEVCEKISAGGDRPDDCTPEKTEENQIPIFSNGVKNNGLYGYTKTPIITKPALTVSARGTIGFACVRYEPFFPIVRLICAIPNDKILVLEFLYYALQYVIPQGEGSSIPQLTIPNFKQIKIPLPPLEEQKRIASGISKIDAYLENTIKLIEEKERFKKGIAKKLLTCKEGENVPEMRFKEFNDKWETKTLMSVADIKKGEQRNILDLIPNGKYPVLNGGMNFSGYYNSYNREANTITISEGGNAGYVNFIKEKFWSSGHCYTLHDLKIDKNFLYQCLKNSEKRLMKLRHGTALKNIKISEIIEFTLDMPKSIEEQNIIGEYLSLLDAEIDNLKEQKEEINKMKSGIIKKLMSGEVRL